ncbi:hypothetical protein M404DRAFT_29553 [Pisolithus tinctorius Marx 270]|uniref:Uncharacterized protein n=1 Tax=Pisolithus tinctorius Marx 270 TaxID=870435 RepID=A0A0C3NZ85_PISTI|nr:hypothetical protein M404DRAFT_29553 [Pisolithus tinctorius Marx 270]
MATVRIISLFYTVSDFFLQENVHNTRGNPPVITLPSLLTCLDASSAHPEPSASTHDDFVVVQVGGGRHEPTPPFVTPMRLHQKVKATTRDTGLVHEASLCRSHMLATDNDDNPFLSEPIVPNTRVDTSPMKNPGNPGIPKPGCSVPPLNTLTGVPSKLPPEQSSPIANVQTNTSLTKNPIVEGDYTPRLAGPAVSKRGCSVPPLSTLTRVPSKSPPDLPVPSTQPSTTLTNEVAKEAPAQGTTLALTRAPGLAPSYALDRLGFEPVGIVENAPAKTVPLMKTILPFPISSFSCPESPTPRSHVSPHPLHSATFSHEHTSEIESDGCGEDGGDPIYTHGRLPAAAMDEFNEGFQQVNNIFSKLGESRGMPWQQVRDCYNCQYSCSNLQNLWNLYSTYFVKHMRTELAWLPAPEVVQGTPSVDMRKACYSCFKAEFPDTYVDILETWKEAEELEDIGGTFAALSKSHAFEGCYILAGRVVNQDAGLAHVFTTPGADGFFPSWCRADTHEIIGHFKAHIYNKVSLDSVTEAFGGTDDVDTEVVVEKGKGKQCAITMDTEVFAEKGKQQPVNEKNDKSNNDDEVKFICSDHECVKQLLRKHIKSFGFKWASQKLFPWKSLLNHLAGSALVLMNWLADVIFPGEECRRKGNRKGISDLTLTDCSKLVAALEDQSTNRLHLQCFPKLKEALLSSKKPVIINAPPSHDSNLMRGKHVFVNSTVDYLGPSRLPNIATTCVRRNKTKKRAWFEVDEMEGLGNSDGVEEVSADKKPSSSTGSWPKALGAPQRSSKSKAARASEVISLSSSSQSQSKSSGDDFHPAPQPLSPNPPRLSHPSPSNLPFDPTEARLLVGKSRPLPRTDVLSFLPILTSFSSVTLPSGSPSLPLARCTSHHLPPCTQQLLPPSTRPFDPKPALRSSNLSLTLINVPETPHSHSPVFDLNGYEHELSLDLGHSPSIDPLFLALRYLFPTIKCVRTKTERSPVSASTPAKLSSSAVSAWFVSLLARSSSAYLSCSDPSYPCHSSENVAESNVSFTAGRYPSQLVCLFEFEPSSLLV